VILVFAVSTGLFVVAQKTGKPLGEISLGSALGPRLGEVPILSGFLWLLPVLLTFSYTEKFSSSIYVRALLGGLFVLVASIFLCANAPFLDFIVWESGRPEILSYFTWFTNAGEHEMFDCISAISHLALLACCAFHSSFNTYGIKD